VPMASGWPGQLAAHEVCATMEASSPTHLTVQGRRLSPSNTLPIIEPRLHSKSTQRLTTGAMNAALIA
jgi:hypothetical protein